MILRRLWGRRVTGTPFLGSGGRGTSRRSVAVSTLDLASLHQTAIPVDPPRRGHARISRCGTRLPRPEAVGVPKEHRARLGFGICQPARQAGTPAPSHLITGGVWKYSGNVVISVNELCLTVVQKEPFFLG